MVYWKEINFEEAKKLVEENPLTITNLSKTLENHVEKVRFKYFYSNHYKGLCGGVTRNTCEIRINCNFNLDEIIFTLIHELAHAYYRISSNVVSDITRRQGRLYEEVYSKIESLIDAETSRFLKQNLNFAIELHDKLRAKNPLPKEICTYQVS